MYRLPRQCRQFSFERRRKLPLHRLAGAFVVAVIGDPVDEKQGEHLDAALPDLQLFFQVALDSVFDLSAPDVIAHPAAFFPHT